ncbi:Hypothetical predicted protein [Lecanosticta acicola]|uniref:Uncharacterized protein n=1 Tax=Lecanosticta acicola TaxID=111012 RepID=A0AAI9EBY7_9PEZI|nr:Hypothetical predicted protein [Lecanosticta acicola]
MSASKAMSQAYRTIDQQLQRHIVRSRRNFVTPTSRALPWSRDQAQYGSERSAFGSAVAGGVIGGGVVFAGWYLWYNYSGARAAVNTKEQVKSYIDAGAEQFKVHFREITPGPTDEVIRSLREVAEKYSAWIPGGREFVDKSFEDMEKIRESHETEVNEIVRDAYEELRDVAKRNGTSLETVNATWYILSRRLEELSSLAGDVAEQVFTSHPELREKLDSSFEELRQLGDRLGPGAKREVDETFSQIANMVKQGVNEDTGDRVNRLVQEKARQIKARNELAWARSWEQMQVLLERNPHVKKIADDNIETLKQGRAKQVAEKIKQAVWSGHTGELERYIKDLSKRSQQYSSGCLSNWLNRLPNGSKILPQLQKLKEASDTRISEAERLAKGTLDDISQLLEQRGQQAERLLHSHPRDPSGSSTLWS